MRSALIGIAILGASAMTSESQSKHENPLIGVWSLDHYEDTTEGGAPIRAMGDKPVGLFVFTADGYVSISFMRDPSDARPEVDSPNPGACNPSWYCSYFGTYTYDPATSSWTTRVLGGNIPTYIGTEQRRSFSLVGDTITISGTYDAGGKTYRTERKLTKR